MSQFSKLKKSITLAIPSLPDVQKINDMQSSIAHNLKDLTTSTSNSLTRSGKALVSHAVIAIDATEDVSEDVMVKFKKSGLVVTEITKSVVPASFLGLDIALVVVAIAGAIPAVPAGLACALIAYASISNGYKNASDKSDELDRQIMSKRFGRYLSVISDYGYIPKNAAFTNQLINVVIDSKSGVITGTVLSGKYKDKPISEMSNDQLDDLAKNADEDTVKIIAMYKECRSKL